MLCAVTECNDKPCIRRHDIISVVSQKTIGVILVTDDIYLHEIVGVVEGVLRILNLHLHIQRCHFQGTQRLGDRIVCAVGASPVDGVGVLACPRVFLTARGCDSRGITAQKAGDGSLILRQCRSVVDLAV